MNHHSPEQRPNQTHFFTDQDAEALAKQTTEEVFGDLLPENDGEHSPERPFRLFDPADGAQIDELELFYELDPTKAALIEAVEELDKVDDQVRQEYFLKIIEAMGITAFTIFMDYFLRAAAAVDSKGFSTWIHNTLSNEPGSEIHILAVLAFVYTYSFLVIYPQLNRNSRKHQQAVNNVRDVSKAFDLPDGWDDSFPSFANVYDERARAKQFRSELRQQSIRRRIEKRQKQKNDQLLRRDKIVLGPDGEIEN